MVMCEHPVSSVHAACIPIATNSVRFLTAQLNLFDLHFVWKGKETLRKLSQQWVINGSEPKYLGREEETIQYTTIVIYK